MNHDQSGYVPDAQYQDQWPNEGQNLDQNAVGAYGDFQAPYQDASPFEAMDQQKNGFAGRGRGGFGRGGFRVGRGGFQHTYGNGMQIPIEPPINAPTGPKAMRDGLPNSGRYSRPGYAQQTSEVAPSHSQEQYDEPPASAAAEQHERDGSRSRSI